MAEELFPKISILHHTVHSFSYLRIQNPEPVCNPEAVDTTIFNLKSIIISRNTSST